MSELSLNEAIFITPDEESVIDCAVEALSDDILSKYALFSISAEAIMQEDRPTGAKITWTMDGESFISREFKKSPCTETGEGFVARIKAYLFDIAVSVKNLA